MVVKVAQVVAKGADEMVVATAKIVVVATEMVMAAEMVVAAAEMVSVLKHCYRPWYLSPFLWQIVKSLF